MQKFPEDFDGVVAGAPANNWVRLLVQSMIAGLANTGPDGKPILGPAQFDVLHQAVIDACDSLDGRKDGEISDPRACRFSAKRAICKPGQDGKTCLTPVMAEAADRIYAPVHDPRTKALIYPGMPPGSERLWGIVVMGPWDDRRRHLCGAVRQPGLARGHARPLARHRRRGKRPTRASSRPIPTSPPSRRAAAS
ncbi:MAG: tannase/feruloyl esterase family alpha/beta hydrolase [Sphingomonas sp.]